MEGKLEKKYGLLTAICMVVGIVIGSGVFFKAQDILNYTGGNMVLGILAWVIGGAVMLICVLNFANLATRYEKVNGLVDYAEATVGGGYAYFMSWFLTTIYYPAMTGVLAWVCARFTLVLFGSDDITGGLCMTLAAAYLVGAYAMNALAPKLSGKFQVSTTFIKMVPLLLMVLVGLIAGLINGNTIDAFAGTAQETISASPLLAGVVAAAFAYEGWIIATSINAELKNAKKNLPIALTVGCIIIAAVYITYFIGLTGATTVEDLKENGSTSAFIALFGRFGGSLLNVFVVISCLGTLNGLMIASTRGMYSVAARGHGPKPETMREISPTTNMPTNASVVGLLLCGLWLFYFYGANLTTPIFGAFSFDSSELPIITIYGMYIPIFIMFIIKHGKENVFRNMVMPALGILACCFMVFAAIYAHGIAPYLKAEAEGNFSFPVLFYLVVFTVIMTFGAFFYRKPTPLGMKAQPQNAVVEQTIEETEEVAEAEEVTK